MRVLKKIGTAVHSRAGAYVFFVLAALSFAFLKSATWTYGWIAQLYPLGDKFVPILLCVIGVCAAFLLFYLLFLGFTDEKQTPSKPKRVLNGIHTVFSVLSVALFVYTAVLLFGLDSGFSAENFSKGISALSAGFVYICLAITLPLVLVFCYGGKKTLRAALACVLTAVLLLLPNLLGTKTANTWKAPGPEITLQSENVLAGASIAFESLKEGESPDAQAILQENDACWTPQAPNRAPAEGQADANNSYVEIELSAPATFNTAVIEEVGNEAQYFRLQAFVEEEWVTIYESEKIEASRLCSFDAVTTDRVRLSIDKFRNDETPVRIRSLRLYNEPVRTVENFEVTAYQRLDGDVPTEI
ncbi:MAG: hypothetical protein ACI4K6_06310, partial [Candidatus Fimenecus sp.]